MFRSQYDHETTTWSPQGRIHQLEYAMEAVKQGAATVGIKSKTHAVLIALKRAPDELSDHQKKIIQLDDHIGISVAGLTADARLLGKFMRHQCLNSKFNFDRPLNVHRLIMDVAEKSQIPTQQYGRRPYGVGLLVAGFDEYGPHIFQTCPSANYYDCKAMAIGSRSQSARTYLERYLDKFPDSTKDELIIHGLRALRDTLGQDVELTAKNSGVAVVGLETPFAELDPETVGDYLRQIADIPRAGQPAPATEGEPMDASDAPPSGQ